MQTPRLTRLRELISTGKFSSQQELVAAMRQAGFQVTQASVSRDLRKLGVAKGAGHYQIPVESATTPPSLIAKMIIAVTPAGPNLVVVRTNPGCANAVADVLDDLDVPGKVGTVAGDDTIFVAAQDGRGMRRIIEAIAKL
jgi:transcriptional regulator of arginine metabolism